MTALLAAADAPSGGAPALQILVATVFALGATAVLLALVARHRTGRGRVLARAGALAQRSLGLEPWAALPFAIGTVGLVAGGFGVFWDISLHMDVGRDEGPLANAAHYFILFCLYSVFAAGVVATALHEGAERPSPRAVRLPGGLDAPVGGALLMLCGAFALAGFPLDDLWHRMFGQDVTLWGPTHLVMINGAVLSVPTLAVLLLEARRAAGRPLDAPARTAGDRLQRAILPGTLLFAIAFWATEFDWGLPQYRLVWQPLLLSLAAALALVAGRIWLGRGGALRVVAFYLVARGAMELAVWVLGQSVPAMPLFLVEAAIVELVAWRGMPGTAPLRFGLLAGVLCGTAGFAAEYGWTQVAAPIPWTTALLAEGAPTALGAGLSGGALGALLGLCLRGQLPARPVRRGLAGGAAAVLVVLGANALVLDNPRDVRAAIALEPVAGAAQREARVVARITPASAARDAEWVQALAWQGGGIVAERMRPAGDGVWRSEGAVPLHGDWKTSLRVQQGRALISVPLHLPREPSVPTPGLDRPGSFTTTFVPDREVMQTERRDSVPGWLWTPSALLMLVLCGAFVVALAAGFARASEDAPGPPAPPRPRAHPRAAASPHALPG